MGAWIETIKNAFSADNSYVAPYMGAWIETLFLGNVGKIVKSHPIWVRGLKLCHKVFD